MATKSKVIEKKSTEPGVPEGRYHYAVGRRKTTIAQVRLYAVEGEKPVAHIVNGKPIPKTRVDALAQQMARAGRPVGGEAQVIRGLCRMIQERFA